MMGVVFLKVPMLFTEDVHVRASTSPPTTYTSAHMDAHTHTLQALHAHVHT